ncbi:MAG: DNA invertase [Thiothrix lacustris]|uniref:DNA invertase n=1 Tax=Thiothrix lacustris TaxID=525917 RepID=A0A1Y1QL54_9GAMM|nr:MAG: DNA invertase [Thiothrix lacustris]
MTTEQQKSLGALVGYARVSTTDQDHTTQVARLQAMGCNRIFSEKKSGTKTEGRTALQECLSWVREGDTLVITKIDRLARSARDLHNIIHDLEERGVGIMIIDQAIDTRTNAGKAMLGMFAIFAEFETNIRRERQMEGIAKAKADGVYKGRKPTARAKLEEMKTLLLSGLNRSQIARELGVSVASVHAHLNPIMKGTLAA